MILRIQLCVVALLGFFLSSEGRAFANKSGASPQVLSLPSGPGSLGGIGENVQANLNMGLMSYSIKVLVPSGRGAATPNPSITYSSSAGAGLMGIGWSFSAGNSIERGTVRGLPRYTNKDVFFAGGELVKIPQSPFYRSRYEGGFARYRWVQKDSSDQRGYWLAEYPDGSKGYYGANSKGELDLNAQVYGLKGTYCWKLVTKVDRNGNRVEYSYFKDGTQSYPDQIAWVFDENNRPLYHLKFRYEVRSDHISDGKPGFDLKTKKRLKEVQITSNGTRFRSYAFEYESHTGFSRLSKVLRYGRDASKAHPVQFTMKYSDAVFSPENSKMVTLPTSLGVDFRSGNIDFLDINGDGLPDVVDTSKAKHLFFINQITLENIKQDKHDFPRNLVKENPKETSAKLSNPSIQMLDFNGDGFTDMVDAVNKKIYVNKGNSKWEDSSTSLLSFPVTGKDPNMRFMDYDGDKKIDVISSDGKTTTFWISDGKGNWAVKPGKINIGLGFSKDKLRLIDINGDGLQDVVHITKNAMRYRKYLGYGEWTDWIDVHVPGIDQYELSTKAQFSDINGDGMADMVAFLGNAIVYFVNKNGESFEAGKKLETFKGVDIPDSSKMTIRIVDINGNGSRDIVWIDSSGRVTYLELFGKRPNLMEAISNGIGQRINVEYGSSVYFYLRDKTCKVGTDKACEGPWKNKMPMAFTVVTKITTWASRASKPLLQATPTADERPTVQEIYYHNGFYDGNEKKFRGFRKVENVEVGDDSIPSRHSFIEYDVGDTDSYFHGRLLRSVIKDSKGKIYSEQRNEWKDCGALGGVDPELDPPVRFICMSASENTVKEALTDSSKWKTVRFERKYDKYGNITEMANLGIKSQSGDELYVRKEFIVPESPKEGSSIWNIRALKTARRCAKAAGPCAQYRYYYDGEPFKGLPHGQLTKGNLTRVEIKASLSQDKWIVPKRREFDSYGNVIAILGPTGQKRTIQWDPVYHRFTTQETVFTEKTSYSTKMVWDYSTSVPLRGTTMNGQVMRYTYDGFGRPLAIYSPGDPDDKPTLEFHYELKAPLSRIITMKRSKQGGEVDRKSFKCFDGLGRMVDARIWQGGDTYSVHTHTDYNARGSNFRIWNTYQGKGQCQFELPTQSKPLFVQLSFDLTGRMIKQQHPDGTATTIEYQPFIKIVRDAEDNDKNSPHYDTPATEILDGLGRVLRYIQIPSPGKTLVTEYTYNSVNALGRHLIATMTFPNGKVKKHEHNLIGNITKIIHPDQTTTEFKYDDNHQIIEKKDARGIVRIATYDRLGRILTQQEKGKDQTRVTFSYDTPHKAYPSATNLKGRTVSVTYPWGTLYSSYDNRGSLTTTRHTLLGVHFDIKRTYNQLGDAQEVLYPDGRKVRFTYKLSGQLLSIPGFLEKITYRPDSLAAKYEYSNGVHTDFSYTKLQQISGISVSSQPGFRYQMEFDKAGNIVGSKEVFDGETTQNKYSYDSLYRLTKAELGGKTAEVLKYAIDLQHNITSKTSSLGSKSPVHVGAYKYDPDKFHAPTQAGSMSAKYGPSGLPDLRSGMGLSWDSMDRLKQVTQGGKTIAKYWYEAGKLRVIKQEHGLHSLYPAREFRVQHGYVSLYIARGHHKLAEWRSTKMMASIYDDLAKNGKLEANDAWLYHAARQKILPAALKKRPIDEDLTKDMLQSAAYRMLSADKDEVYHLHTDHLGSIRMVTDSKGKVLRYKRYYPYGAIRSQRGTLHALDFQGTERDLALDLNYFGARFLDTKLGKWLSPDPAFEAMKGKSDEWNRYSSTHNNPLRYRDLHGLLSEESVSGFGLCFDIGRSVFQMIHSINGFMYLSKMAPYLGKGFAISHGVRNGIGAVNSALYAASAVFTALGDGETSGILRIVAGSLNFVKSVSNLFLVQQKYKLLTERGKAYGIRPTKKRRVKRAALGITSTLAGAVSTGAAAAAINDDSGVSTIVYIAASVVSTIAAFQNARMGFADDADFDAITDGNDKAKVAKGKKLQRRGRRTALERTRARRKRQAKLNKIPGFKGKFLRGLDRTARFTKKAVRFTKRKLAK